MLHILNRHTFPTILSLSTRRFPPLYRDNTIHCFPCAATNFFRCAGLIATDGRFFFRVLVMRPSVATGRNIPLLVRSSKSPYLISNDYIQHHPYSFSSLGTSSGQFLMTFAFYIAQSITLPFLFPVGYSWGKTISSAPVPCSVHEPSCCTCWGITYCNYLRRNNWGTALEPAKHYFEFPPSWWWCCMNWEVQLIYYTYVDIGRFRMQMNSLRSHSKRRFSRAKYWCSNKLSWTEKYAVSDRCFVWSYGIKL